DLRRLDAQSSPAAETAAHARCGIAGVEARRTDAKWRPGDERLDYASAGRQEGMDYAVGRSARLRRGRKQARKEMKRLARLAVESVARDSRARLLAFLAARAHDIAAAEDALSDAFRSALERWPHDGVPDVPEAWLLTVARRRLIDAARHSQVQSESAPELIAAVEDAQSLLDEEQAFPDERLKLMFVCAHPAIDTAARTPLMLQTVLGLDAVRIASAFLVKPAAMGQRLSRVKTKIRGAGIAFEVPRAQDLPERLDAVLQAVYAAYGSGWDDVAGADPRRKGLAAEALELGALLVQLMPNEPETLGLSALMLYCESRRDARRNEAGEYVPLSEQDVGR